MAKRYIATRPQLTPAAADRRFENRAGGRFLTRPCLAAITLNTRGGGVAAVARLIWRTFEDRWPGAGRLVTLVDDDAAEASLHSTTPTRMRFGARLAAAQASRACDWIMYSHLSLAKVQAFVPAAVRLPYAVFIHGIEAWRELPETQKAVLRDARLRVANSSFTARRVMAMHPEIGPVVPCPLALPPDQFVDHGTGLRPASDSPPTAVIVARMSADERYKGHDELLDAWPELVRLVPDARLVIVGDGDDAGRLKAKASDLGLAVPSSSRALCHRPNCRTCIAARACSRCRAAARALVSSTSKPCCTACRASAPQRTPRRKSSTMARPGSSCHRPIGQALIASLARLLTDDAMQRRMAANAERHVRTRFSYEQFASTLVDRLEESFGVAPALNRVAM